MKTILLMSHLFFGVLSTLAQPARPAPTPNDTLTSIRVLPTNRVVFSIYAPKATAVTVSGDFSRSFGPGITGWIAANTIDKSLCHYKDWQRLL